MNILLHLAGLVAVGVVVSANHALTITNRCGYGVQPRIASCVDLPAGTPCNGYGGGLPGYLNPGGSETVTLPSGWNGRVFVQANSCDANTGDCYSTGCTGCTLTEFNTDVARNGGQQYWDISNINGFTQSVSVGIGNCGSTTCTSGDCPCNQAYRRGDYSGTCGGSGPVDQAVRACGAGEVPITVTFCP